MKTEYVLRTIPSLININRTFMLVGPPGSAKTSMLRQACEKMGIGYISKHGPMMLTEDFGIPFKTEKDGFKELEYILAHWFPSQEKVARGLISEKGVLVGEEVPQADNSQQKIWANICQERELHGVKLADGWVVAFTGNRQEDRSGANALLRHFANRMTIITVEPDLEATMEWCLKHGMKPEIGAFWRFRPALMCAFDAKNQSNPTPRSWMEGVSPILGNVPEEAEYECIIGAVGEGAASEFKGFLKVYRHLPDPDKCIKEPDAFKVPTDMATLYALCGAIAHRAKLENIENIVKITKRLPPEFSVCLMRDAARRDLKITQHQAWVAWGRENIKFLR